MIYKSSSNHAGFSILEMLVVIAIMALIGTFAVPSISSFFKIGINSASRNIASIAKEAFNSSMITGRVYRIAYDLKSGEYWAEGGPPTVLLDTADTREKEKRRSHIIPKGDAAPPSDFSMDSTITRKKIALPSGTTYEDIITQQDPDPIKQGKVYTHFFPQGFTEQTIVHIKDDSDHHVSLIIAPLLGRTDVYDRYVTRQEAFGK